MKEERFDELTRQFTRFADRPIRRRRMLKWAVGGVAMAANVVPAHFPAARNAGAQSAPGRRAAGQPDVAKIAFDLEYDMDKIFRFVTDQVRYEPYAGALRGPMGTLWGMSANSIDKALLLVALLNEARIVSRIVLGEIDDRQAATLLDLATIDANALKAEHQAIAGKSSLASIVKDTPTPIATPAGEAAIIDLGQRAASLRPIMIDTTRSRLNDTVRLLDTQLGAANVVMNAPEFSLPQRELARHAWVQIAQGAEWLDLDPCFPDAEPGTVFGVHGAPVSALDDADYHQITVRVLGDMVRGGTVNQEELLTYTGRSMDLVGAPISFFHAKPQWMGDAISEALGGTDQYQPFLQVGSELIQGARFAFGGQGGVIDALGGGSSSREGEPVAEWMEITISSPDSDTLTEMRTVFDRIGDDARTRGIVDDMIATLPPVETVSLDDKSGETFLPLLGATNIAVVSAPVPVRYFVQDWAITDAAGDLAYQNHSYHYLRDMLGAELAAETGLRFVRSRPAVTLLDIGVEIADDAQRFMMALDLVQPSHSAAPLKGTTPGPNAGLVEGVLNQVCERNLFELTAQAVPETLTATFKSVGLLFEQAEKQGVSIRTIPAGSPLPDDLASAISPAARIRIASLLDSGFAIILPEQPIDLNGAKTTGWWAINPATGRTLDRFENGRGPELAEEATLLDVVLEVVHEAYILGSCIASLAVVAGCVIAVVAEVGGDGALGGAVGGAVHGFAMCAAALA